MAIVGSNSLDFWGVLLKLGFSTTNQVVSPCFWWNLKVTGVNDGMFGGVGMPCLKHELCCCFSTHEAMCFFEPVSYVFF